MPTDGYVSNLGCTRHRSRPQIYLRAHPSPELERARGKKPTPRVTDASKNSMVLSRVVALYVRIANMTTTTHLLVADNLAVNAISGTEFIDRHVRCILPKERPVVFRDEGCVTLLGSTPEPEGNQKNRGNLPTRTRSNKVRVAKQIATDVPSACIGKHRGKRPGVPPVSPKNG